MGRGQKQGAPHSQLLILGSLYLVGRKPTDPGTGHGSQRAHILRRNMISQNREGYGYTWDTLVWTWIVPRRDQYLQVSVAIQCRWSCRQELKPNHSGEHSSPSLPPYLPKTIIRLFENSSLSDKKKGQIACIPPPRLGLPTYHFFFLPLPKYHLYPILMPIALSSTLLSHMVCFFHHLLSPYDCEPSCVFTITQWAAEVQQAKRNALKVPPQREPQTHTQKQGSSPK